jgi:hypothetical protein
VGAVLLLSVEPSGCVCSVALATSAHVLVALYAPQQ